MEVVEVSWSAITQPDRQVRVKGGRGRLSAGRERAPDGGVPHVRGALRGKVQAVPGSASGAQKVSFQLLM
ncbi:hypothetical protein GCM10009801_38580 [Streptomyces albiaxialis]|uniref:Uncharacterized protein n=1 Tax=Streptomyces albiaxialis TaxID=329523 RepID=A0ABN2W113_9ACTN